MTALEITAGEQDSEQESEMAALQAEQEDTESVDAELAQMTELPPEDVNGCIEALIFANGEPLSLAQIIELTGIEESVVLSSLGELKAAYLDPSKGFELVEVAERYQFRTKAKFSPFIQALKAGRPKKLSAPALETLAIIAYRQPIVKSDVEKLRGVDATPTIKTLLDRKLIKIVGHQASVGQPALYGTTDDFLKIFGLGNLNELPTLRDLKELDDPGEIEEATNDQVADSAHLESNTDPDAQLAN